MKPRESCGVFAAFSRQGNDVVPKVLRGLEALQHRGQEAWGIAVPGKPVFKKMGLEVQWHNYLSELVGYKGQSAIGHIRYSTKGKSTLANAQPIQIASEFSIGHNGTVVNAATLLKKVPKEQRRGCDTDTKAVGLRLLQILKQENDWFWAFEALSNEVVGAYSFVLLNKRGEVYAVRDPRGYRPLCLGFHKKSGTHLAASESCALDVVDAEFVRDVEPGEMVRLGGPKKGFESFRFAPKMEAAHCSFEYTYFAHPASKIDGVSVYEARKKVGRILARRHNIRGNVVIPVPDSARPAALGYSVARGIPMDEGLMKDRYKRKGSIRSFIEPRQGSREEVVKQIIPIREAIAGKNVIVVDDSIVRGTSSRIIVSSLRRAGAKKVGMVVTFPPIAHPCYMGVDFPSREELLANQAGKEATDLGTLTERIRASLNLDELGYNDIDGLSEAIGLPKESMCFACVNGDYSKLGSLPKSGLKKELESD